MKALVADALVAVAVAGKLGNRLRDFLHYPVSVAGRAEELLGL